MAAAKTWNVDRQKGGSYEFSLDASGNYVLNSVGFNKVNTLNLPELKKDTTVAATTTKDTKTASDQTKKAFGDVQPFYYDKKGGGGDKQYTTEYQMTKDKSLDTTQPMTKGAWDRGQWGPKPGDTGKPMTTGDGPWTMRSGKADTKPISAVDKARVTAGEFINKIDDKSTAESGMQFTDPAPTKVEPVSDRYKYARGPQQVNVPVSDKFAKSIAPQRVSVPKKETLTQTALKQVKSASNTLSKALGFVMSPVSSAIGMVAGAIKETPMNKHDKTYFNINPAEQGGRISGNPAEDLYAGMNRVSASGNLNKAGNKRLATRRATAKRKGYDENSAFVQKTKKMEGQAIDYQKSQTKVMKNVPPSQRGGGGGNGGPSGRVICTELHSTGEISTRDWIRDIRFTYKDLSKEHIKGYLLWAVPTVEHIKKYPTYRKFWKHLAQHRANDIAWRLNQGKFDLLGRIYAGIGEPLCWLIGKCISDKQIKELELNNWRQA